MSQYAVPWNNNYGHHAYSGQGLGLILVLFILLVIIIAGVWC